MKDGLVSLVDLLSGYSEEGEHLFPELFLFDDSTDIKQSLPNSELVVVGRGSKQVGTFELALKRCARLARWGWSIYLCRTAHGLEYGLLRCGLTALSLTASELLVGQGDAAVPVILVRHLSRHTIEISGASGHSVRIHYGATSESTSDPILIADNFCASVVADVEPEVKVQARNFYLRIFASVIRRGHGCLAAVLPPGERKLPKQFRDGVEITPRLDIAAKIGSLLNFQSCEGDTQLRAAAGLIQGMLSTDGVTLFSSNGTVCAYNVFVKDSNSQLVAAASFGGARRRAFKLLCGWLGKSVESAFFLSQDGHAEFKGKNR
jgi:hypothetical protein